MGQDLNYSGLVIAVIGFGLTRFTVTLAFYQEPLRFYLAGVLPLALGLGLAAFGVALTVAAVDRTVVRTTAVWCVIGVGTMLIVAVLTVIGSQAGESMTVTTTLSRTYLSNFLIVGGIGGTFTGLYAARTRNQQRRVQSQANTLVILNRLLRHEVLNAITAIRGYALRQDGGTRDAEAVVRDQSTAIVETIDEVNYLTRHAGLHDPTHGPVSVGDAIREGVAEVRDRHPDVEIDVGEVPEDLEVEADEHLSRVIVQLVENAVIHGGDGQPAIAVGWDRREVQISVSDAGPGLPAMQRQLLEAGAIEEFDNPRTGFGLNLVRLFVDGYGGDIETDVDEEGTTITVVLPRYQDTGPYGSGLADVSGVRPAAPHLAITVVAALVAGVAYGGVSELFGGSVAGIGVFYGVSDPVVGWITHEFHSVVFGLVYIGLVSVAPPWAGDGMWRFLGIGIVWSVALWLGAAGVIAPVWLRLLGFSTSVPNLSGMLLASHVVWGVVLSVVTIVGYRYVVPRIEAASP